MLKRFGITLFIILTINFFLPRWMQADPFLFFSEDESGLSLEYSEKELQKYRSYYGLDQPLVVQYIKYMTKSFIGDFGYSIVHNRPIARLLWQRIFWTLGIVVVSLFISVLIGGLLGCFSAWLQGRWIDKLLYSIHVIASQIPHFIVASLVLLLFSTVFRGVLPTSGGSTPFVALSWHPSVVRDVVRHGILPVLALTLIRIPDFYMIMRGAMISEINKAYVITANAKGMSSGVILLKHCLVNALNPMITKIFMTLGHLFGSAIIIENIFSYPGIGMLMRDAVFLRDYPLIQAIFFVMAILVMIFSQLTEYFYNHKV